MWKMPTTTFGRLVGKVVLDEIVEGHRPLDGALVLAGVNGGERLDQLLRHRLILVVQPNGDVLEAVAVAGRLHQAAVDGPELIELVCKDES